MLGQEVYGNAFTCEPVHNLVSRQVLKAKGATFTSDRHPDELGSEFFASTDSWSRPVSVRTGPDGALWVADMYRFVIEHPEWIPQEWQKKLDLRAGTNMGRIYRVVPDTPDSPKIPRVDRLEDAALVARLESPNGPLRDLVHQMLLWRGGNGAVPSLREMVSSGSRPIARVQALCILDGLGELDAETVRIALADSDPGVVRHAARLSLNHVPAAELAKLSDAMLDDAFVAIELSGVLDGGEVYGKLIADLLARHENDPHALPILLSAIDQGNLETVISQLTQPGAAKRANLALPTLSRMAAKWREKNSLSLLSAYLIHDGAIPQTSRTAILSALFDGGASIEDLAGDEANRAKLHAFFDELRARVKDTSLPDQDRAGAARFLGHPSVFAGESDLRLLAGLLVPQSPPLLREAVLEALGRARPAGTPKALTSQWKTLAPSDRARALGLLLGRSDWTSALLDAVESGSIVPGEVDASSRSRLLDLKDPALRQRAETLLGSASAENREEVLRAHQDVFSIKGDPASGKSVFATVCIACHVAEGIGQPVGPDLAALTDRSPESMLVAILDPNRAIEDKFLNYTLTTQGGDSIFGLIADEGANSVSIRQADGTARSVPRQDISSMASTGVSLMPEGFEKILTKPQLADLLAYLGSLGSDAPSTPKGNIDMAARISPGKGGVVELRASRCRLDGERIEYMPDFDAIGWWTSERDRAQWTLVLDRPRSYRVEWEYSVSPDAAGNSWQIEIGGKEFLSGTVASTGGWETFKTESLGTVNLPAADNHVVVRSKGPVKGALFDLRAIRFVPVAE